MNKELISYLRLLHGAFNALVFSLVLYQGVLGFRIRRSEKKPVQVVRRHRRLGPFLPILGGLGFLAGIIIVFLDSGRVFKFPLHFAAGLTIVILLMTTFIISKKIKGPEPYWRNRHFFLGILIILFYLVQIILGLGMLL